MQGTRAFACSLRHGFAQPAKVRRRHFTQSVNAAERSVACSEMTHYLNFVQTSLSGYTHSNLSCKNIDFWERQLAAGKVLKRRGVWGEEKLFLKEFLLSPSAPLFYALSIKRGEVRKEASPRAHNPKTLQNCICRILTFVSIRSLAGSVIIRFSALRRLQQPLR